MCHENCQNCFQVDCSSHPEYESIVTCVLDDKIFILDKDAKTLSIEPVH